MSLILEALKKSEANRRLGEAPDLGTPFAMATRRRNPLPFIAAAIIIAGGVGWWLLRAPPTAETSAPAAQAIAPAPAQPKTAVTLSKPAPPARPGNHGVNVSNFHLPIPDTSGSPADPADVERAASAPPAAVAMSTLPPAGAKQPEAPSVAHKPVITTMAAQAGLKKSEAPVAKAPATNMKPDAAQTVAPRPVAALAAPAPGVKKPEAVVANAPAAESKTAPPPAVAAMPRAAPDPANSANPAGTPVAKDAAPAPESAQPYNELPFSLRKDLPAIKLSMHVYAPDPLQRFVIVNDSRMIEGDAQDDLGLREIRPDGVVFEFRGQRFFYPRDGL